MHEKSEGHVNATFPWDEHKQEVLVDSSVLDAINKAYNKKVQDNRKYIKVKMLPREVTAGQKR